MKIVVITGMDGSGKTTLIAALSKQLDPHRHEYLHLPHSTFVGDVLRAAGDGTPFGDPWTDRLIFALDNRLTANIIKVLAEEKAIDTLLMQRGWMDGFIYGAVQGFSYQEIAHLIRVEDLPRASCSIYLNCDPTIAYERVKDNPRADKFETLPFLRAQYQETQHFYDALDSDPLLKDLFPETRFHLDTSHLAQEAVESKVVRFLKGQKIL